MEFAQQFLYIVIAEFGVRFIYWIYIEMYKHNTQFIHSLYQHFLYAKSGLFFHL